MFSFEESIVEWRQQMIAAGIKAPVPLEELEIHLREEIERRIQSGTLEQHAFTTAVACIGRSEPLNMEFKKIDAEGWGRPLAWAAWALFTISFFLPAYGTGAGWACAWLSVVMVTSPDVWLGNWPAIHLTLLTEANLLMLASPFLLSWFSGNGRVLKWLRWSSFAALALVWSYVLLWLTVGGGRNDLKIGCYVWAVSFLLLFLSTLKIGNRNTESLREQYV